MAESVAIPKELLKNLYVGKYRIIYRVEPSSQTVILLDVGLRKTIYE